jgi:hypothetical protein
MAYDPGSRSNYKDKTEAVRRALWLKMDSCDWCGALAKMPCRDSTSPGRVFVMNRPHRGRPAIKEEK